MVGAEASRGLAEERREAGGKALLAKMGATTGLIPRHGRTLRAMISLKSLYTLDPTQLRHSGTAAAAQLQHSCSCSEVCRVQQEYRPMVLATTVCNAKKSGS